MVALAQQAGAELVSLAELVANLDSTVLILLFAFSLHKGWLHLPREIGLRDQIIDQRDRLLKKAESETTMWQRLFLDAVHVADRAVDDEDV